MTTLDLESAAALLGISPSTLQRVGGECGECQSETEKESGVNKKEAFDLAEYANEWDLWQAACEWQKQQTSDEIESLRQRVKEFETEVKKLTEQRDIATRHFDVAWDEASKYKMELDALKSSALR